MCYPCLSKDVLRALLERLCFILTPPKISRSCVSRIFAIIIRVAVIMSTAEKVIFYVGTTKQVRDR